MGTNNGEKHRDGGRKALGDHRLRELHEQHSKARVPAGWAGEEESDGLGLFSHHVPYTLQRAHTPTQQARGTHTEIVFSLTKTCRLKRCFPYNRKIWLLRFYLLYSAFPLASLIEFHKI